MTEQLKNDSMDQSDQKTNENTSDADVLDDVSDSVETKSSEMGSKVEEHLEETDSDDELLESGGNMEALMDMYEESFKRFQEGEVVVGKIISVDKDYVLVDIGYKSEGQIRIREFIDEDGNITAKEGDTVEVMVEWWDEDDEVVVLSKEKAAKVKVWEDIKKAYDDNGIITGTIESRVKGGFSVDIGVQAFLPGSQADLRPIRNLDEMVGQTLPFKILKYEPF
jgi:small subunit ribosomal protein S1